MSHSAILAREMGVPAIVAIPELLARLRSGDVVEMDGTTGVVRVVPTAAAAFGRRAEGSRGAGRTSTASGDRRYNLARSAG